MVVTMDTKNVICTLVGDGMVGKTCLAKVFADKVFPDQYVATVQDRYSGQAWFAGDQYSITITDSAGEHEGSDVRRMSYCKSDVILLCYSVLDRESYDSLRTHWSREVGSLAKRCPVLVVALQTDKRTTKHVTTEEGRRMTKSVKANGFIECSARNVSNVKDVFENVVRMCLKNRKRKVTLLKRILGR
ncbi:ras-like GTP-binding protein RhoL [Mizuhopecten yessoensis]|uniref:Ras-like GTP-binding protein RhoL n=1 Tax=Mizuhopecten yessoensis TaxID=6573 RepID=A0A210QQ04_MIZYE|nr:ras-like GTP-binding protein RhoL [Mizuhopecten yessoensis]OWF50815.1 Ras-like GTP-binding protein RhoL [Mizuhopecten yessoensis]